MARTIRFSQVLWWLTTAWLAACGRLSFDVAGGDAGRSPGDDAAVGNLPDDAGIPPDSPLPPDAPPAIDAPLPIDGPPPAPGFDALTSLTFNAACGAGPTDRTLMVMNTGTADLAITSAAIDSQFGFSVVDFDSPIAPSQTGTVTVRPPMATVGSDQTGEMFNGTLTLETNAGLHKVNLVATVTGATIVNNATNSVVNFTSNSGACPAAVAVRITNSGNLPIALDQLFASGVAFTGFTGGTLASGAASTVTIRPTLCTGASGASTVLAFSAQSGASGASSLCQAQPININLQIAFTSTGGCACS